MSKLTIPFETCWVLMSITKGNTMPPDHPGHVKPGAKFWRAGNLWTSSPAIATIFRCEDDAIRQIEDARYHKRAGFMPIDIVDAVPLEGAMLTLGTLIEVRMRNRPDEAV